jgi:hypothetical protein
MPVRQRTDPDIRVCRWNGQLPDARDLFGIAQPLAFFVAIAKAVAALDPVQSGHPGIDVDQAIGERTRSMACSGGHGLCEWSAKRASANALQDGGARRARL